MILTYSKDFSCENEPKFTRFQRKIKSKIIIFLQEVPVGSKRYRRILIFFLVFISSMQPNLAKSSFGWLPPQLHLKIEEKNPAEM
jgi:hypothetical protein